MNLTHLKIKTISVSVSRSVQVAEYKYNKVGLTVTAAKLAGQKDETIAVDLYNEVSKFVDKLTQHESRRYSRY